jgi:hypothetical protein
LALAVGLVLTGEVSLSAPRLTGLEPDLSDAFQPTTPITLTFDQPMDRASVEAAFGLEPAVPGTFRWNSDRTVVAFIPEGAGYEPGMAYRVRLSSDARAGTLPLTTARTVEWSFSLPSLLNHYEPPPGAVDLGPRPRLRADFHYALDCAATLRTFSITPDALGLLTCKDQTLTFAPAESLQADTTYVASLENVYLEGDPWPRPGVHWEFRTAPPLDFEEGGPGEAGIPGHLWIASNVRRFSFTTATAEIQAQ